MELLPNITDFSHELLCQILKYLPLREILSVAMLCKKMATAVDMHLRLCKSIDFCQDAICGYMPSTVTDDHLLILLKKCPHLETVYGLHPVKIERRRLRKRSALTIPGIIEALSLCFHLKAIETSDLRLFEAIMQHLPHIEIIGHFQNRDGSFPPQASQRLKLQPYPRISSLHLIGVEVPELTAMPHLQHLHLQCVRFTKLQPFRAFLAQNLKSFVMKHCIGPSVPQRYLSLIIALSSSPNLNHLELVRVPLLNGLFQRAVEDSYRHNGFVNLRTLVISGCKGVLEADLGHLMIVSSKNLETLYIQPSLTKDSLFVSLSYAQCVFPRLRNLHLGYIDTLSSAGDWTNDALLSLGLAEVPDTPSSITDSGMKVISELFPQIRTMSVSNCPHLMIMYHWMSSDDNDAWSMLTDLTLQKCHCLQLSSFALFISLLSNIEVVILNDMFREPPKGCSHVGLSAGTGLGMSSAVVSNQDEHIAVQGHHQDFEHPGDEENEENEREFIDVENEEPHFMVLQRDFFDGEEEEEDDDGADVVLDDHDPGVALELQNNEEHNNADNCINDNSLQMNEREVVNENNFCNNEPSGSVDDKILYIPAIAITKDLKILNPEQSNYHIITPSKNLAPSMKSVHVQCDTLPEECYEDEPSNSDTVKKSSFHNSDMSDDSYKSDDDVKMCVCSKLSDYNYDADYDPHKPSTSKAGRHLDYSVPCDAKLFNASDSETDQYDEFGRDTKQSKESLDKQEILTTRIVNLNADKLSRSGNDHYEEFGRDTKQSKDSLDEQEFLTTRIVNLNADKLSRSDWPLELNVDDYPPETENGNLHGEVSDNSSSQNHFSNLSTSLDEMCKLVKPCVVLVRKFDSSNSVPENSNNTLDNKRNIFENDVPTLESCNSLERESGFFFESGVNECWSPDVSVSHNYFANGTIEKSSEDCNFNESLNHDNEILVENIENSGEINALDNENASDSMICVLIERLDNVYSGEMLENCVESVELTEDSSLQDGGEIPKICSFYSLADKDKDSLDNIPMQCEEIPKDYERLWQEGTSRKEDNYEHVETEICRDSVIKTENDCSHYYGSGSHETNESGELNMLNIDAMFCNCESEYEIPIYCSCEQSVPHCENAYEMKDACTTSDYKMSDNELSMDEERSHKLHPSEDILKVKTEEMIGNGTQVTDMNYDIPYENTVGTQGTVSHITTNEKEITSKLITHAENSKMQDEKFYETSKKRSFTNSCKIEPYENSVIEKQDDTNPVISFTNSDLTPDGIQNSVSSVDKYSGIPECPSSKIHSKDSSIDDICQCHISRDDYNESKSSVHSDLTADGVQNSVCSMDYSGIPESASKDSNKKHLKIHSKDLNIHDPCQCLTSRDDYNESKSSVQSTTSVKRAKSLIHTNSRVSVSHTRRHTNSSHSITTGENEGSGCSTSGMVGMSSNFKDENQSDENSETESELSLPIAKRLRRSYDDCHNNNDDDTDSKYYLLVSDASTDIINSSTGESHRIPACSVPLTKADNKTSKLPLRAEIKAKYCKRNSKKLPNNSNIDTNFNLCLPSSSKDENLCESVMEACKLHSGTGVNCHKCDTSEKKIRKTYSMRSKKRPRNFGKIEDDKQGCKQDFKKENESYKESLCKHCKNICDHPSSSSLLSKERTEKLKITNSDATVFIKNRHEQNSLSNLHVESKTSVENIDVNSLENAQYSNLVVKKESDEGTSNFSEKYSDVYQNNNIDSKNDISDSTGVNVIHNGRRTRRKRISISQKQGRKLHKNSLGKSDHLNKHTRNCSKKVPAVPTVCLISQGTQANSADIRRSVRRIRRATAQARRTMPSNRLPRNSSHSNKISAKTLNKKPVNMNPRPEMHDKATSTSDPLLEDDAVQTLQLTSKTLLSFTVVSCGISDIIIDNCPKLFHIEVQACRILKKFHLNYCSALKRLNVSQCPKLSICALASPVMAVEPDSYILVSYEPCMQGYHPGEGEKAILSRAALEQNVFICHDISAISHEGFQAMLKEKLIEWFRYLFTVRAVLKPIKSKTASKKYEESDGSEYPWFHDLRRIHGKYADLPSTDFCHSDGRYELVTNSTFFCDYFETHQLDTGFPAISDCDAHRDRSLISHEAKEKFAKMKNKFIGFYVPVTENNQINF